MKTKYKKTEPHGTHSFLNSITFVHDYSKYVILFQLKVFQEEFPKVYVLCLALFQIININLYQIGFHNNKQTEL